jgi:hypothetical protein
MKTIAASSHNRAHYKRLLSLDRSIVPSCRKAGQPSRRTRNLTARELDSVLRIKVFKFPADAARKQIVHFRAEHAGEDKQFEIGNAPLHIFKARHRFPAGVPTEQLQLDGKVILRPPPLPTDFPHLWADDVQLCRLFFDAGTLATGHGQSWRLYLTSCEQLSLAGGIVKR